MRPPRPRAAIEAFTKSVVKDVEQDVHHSARRFHLHLRDADGKEFGASVRVSWDATLQQATLFACCSSDNPMGVPGWTDVSVDQFLKHAWIDGCVLSCVSSALTEIDVQAAFNNANPSNRLMVTFWDGCQQFKREEALHNVLVPHRTVVRVDRASVDPLRSTDPLRSLHTKAMDAWNSTIKPRLSDAWNRLTAAHGGSTTIDNNYSGREGTSQLAPLNAFHKSQMSFAICDAVDGTTYEVIKTLQSCVVSWAGKCCEPFVARILKHEANPKAVYEELHVASAQLGVLRPLLDVIFHPVERGGGAVSSAKVSTAIDEAVQLYLYGPCYRHLGKIVVQTIDDYRHGSMERHEAIRSDRFTLVKSAFNQVQFADAVQTPCLANGVIFFEGDSQRLIADVRAGAIRPSDYVSWYAKRVLVERDIAEALVYPFDQSLGYAMTSRYVALVEGDPNAPIAHILEHPTGGLAALLRRLTGPEADTCLEDFALVLSAGQLPIPKEDSAPERTTPTGSAAGTCRLMVQTAVTKAMDAVHAAFDRPPDSGDNSQQPNHNGVTFERASQYVRDLIGVYNRYKQLHKLLEEVMVTSEALDCMRSLQGFGAYAKSCCAPACSDFWLAVRDGVKESFKNRSQRLKMLRDEAADRDARTVAPVIPPDIETPVAAFVDHICRNRMKDTPDVAEQLLTTALELGTHMANIDVFQEELRARLASRLMSANGSGDDCTSDFDTTTLNACQKLFGRTFTYPMERMIVERSSCADLNREFEKRVGSDFEVLPNFLVLTQAHWRNLSTVSPWKMPVALEPAIGRFTMYYLAQNPVRTLMWVQSESNGECTVKLAPSKEVSGSLAYMSILLALSEAPPGGLSVAELRERCLDDAVTLRAKSIDDASIMAQLQDRIVDIQRSTAQTNKNKVPLIVVKTCEASGTRMVSINGKFACSARKLQIAKTSSTDRQTTDKGMAVLRTIKLDGLIVRIMKSRRTVPLGELVEQTMLQSASSFVAQPKDIKIRIEDLMGRNFIRRDEERHDLLHYIA